jgi:TonB family protein
MKQGTRERKKTRLPYASIVMVLLLLAGCAAKPRVDNVAFEIASSAHPVRLADGEAPASVTVVRTGAGYGLKVGGRSESVLAVETNLPILLPTFFAPDAIAYVELIGPISRFAFQDLASGKRQAAADPSVITNGCHAELEAAFGALRPGSWRVWTDEQASRAAQGTCRIAFDKAVAKLRFDSAQAVLRAHRFAEAKTMLLAFVAAHPDDEAVASALFYAGVADYALRNYASAADLFLRSAASPSASPSRAADALLAASDCALELGDRNGSLDLLARIVQRYPVTDEAKIARRRLDREKRRVDARNPDDDIEEPRYAIAPRVDYPRISSRLGEQGLVMADVVIETSGALRQVRLAKSSGFPRLDQAALDSWRETYYFPARALNGEKKTVQIRAPIHFQSSERPAPVPPAAISPVP